MALKILVLQLSSVAIMLGQTAGVTHTHTTQVILSDIRQMNDSCLWGNKFCEASGDRYYPSDNCKCDERCAEYHDCCPDAPGYNMAQQAALLHAEEYECVTLWDGESVYMKSSCRPGWQDMEVARLCHFSSPTNMSTSPDPLDNLPVTSTDTNVTYANYYCAICNDDDQTLDFWGIQTTCPSLMQYVKKHILSNLVFHNNGWGVYLPPLRMQEFHRCNVNVQPSGFYVYKRPCAVINTCASDWKNSTVQDLCHSYTALRYVVDPKSGWLTTYRNPHCLICNFLTVEESICSPRTSYYTDKMFDDSFSITESSATDLTCEPGQVIDPFQHTCRSVVCGDVYQQNTSGNCVDNRGHAPATSSTHQQLYDDCRVIFVSNENFFETDTGKLFFWVDNSTHEVSKFEALEGGARMCLPESARHILMTISEVTGGMIYSNMVARNLMCPASSAFSFTSSASSFTSSASSFTSSASSSPLVPPPSPLVPLPSPLVPPPSEDCRSDASCAVYGDCCLNSIYYNLEDQNSPLQFECVTVRYSQSVYMRTRCLVEWQHTETARMCQAASPSEISTSSDRLLYLPITSITTNITYPNYYCAFCNHDTLALQPWETRLNCPHLWDQMNNEVLDNMVYQQGSWGVILPSFGMQTFQSCSINLVVPWSSTLRYCQKTVNTCASNWTDATVEALCHSYTAVRESHKFNLDFYEHKLYRNPSCAECNFEEDFFLFYWKSCCAWAGMFNSFWTRISPIHSAVRLLRQMRQFKSWAEIIMPLGTELEQIPKEV